MSTGSIPPLTPPPGASVIPGRAQIFISFIHEEQTVAEAVQRLIQDVLKCKVFISSDKSAVFAGEQWLEKIKEAITNARIAVLMLSQESVKRQWVHFEAGAAWLQDSVIIPACFNNLNLKELAKPYSDFQSVDLASDSGPYDLVSAIARHLVSIPPPPPNYPPDADAYAKFRATLVSCSGR